MDMKQKVTFIHCADIHLDAPFKNVGRDSFSMERRKDLKKTFETVIHRVNEEDMDFLLISGDLYEHDYVTQTTIRWVNEQFSKLGDKLVVMVPGNHDPYVKNAWYRSYPWHTNVHILTTENPEYFDESMGVYFYGIGFDTFRQDKLPEMKTPVIAKDRINICLFHGTVDMAFSQDYYNPISSRELIEKGFDYYALGHFHVRNESLAEKGIINPGSPEPLGFDEQGEHGIYRVSLEKTDGKVHRQYSFIPVQQRKYREFDLDVSDCETESKLHSLIAGVPNTYGCMQDVVKVNLKGRISPDIHIDLESLEQILRDECFSLSLSDSTQPSYVLEEMAKEKNITGVFIQMIQEKMSNADTEEKAILEKALYLGLEALLTGKVERIGH